MEAQLHSSAGPVLRRALRLAPLFLLVAAPAAQRVLAGTPIESPRRPCGSDVSLAELPLLLELEALGMHDPSASPEFFFTVPLTFHIVRRSNGSGGLTVSQADENIPILDQDFLSSGIRFERVGAVDFIDNTFYYEQMTTTGHINALRMVNPVPNTINVYFVGDFSDGGTTLCGKSSFTTSPVQGIVLDNECTASAGDGSTFAHEMGHYFDLYHTHETMFGLECPDGSNCAIAGDLLCDTPADPNLFGFVSPSCQFTAIASACGQQYSPTNLPIDNLMSYSRDECQTSFTPAQRQRMGATLLNLRADLIGSQAANVLWVDFSHTGLELGSFSFPYATLTAALGAASPGTRIVIKSSASSGTITVDQNVVLDSFRGTSTIGS